MSDKHVYEVFIRTTPDKLWNALLDPEMTKKYFFGTMVKTSRKPGEAIVYTMPDGSTATEGEVLAIEPNQKLVHTWIVRYDPALAHERSTVTWQIEKRGDACKLTVTHELAGAPGTAKSSSTDGWSLVLSGLKTILETGEPLTVART